MASDAASLDPALADFAATLTQENTPAKLRCVNCHNIAINAWRIPCCAQDSCDSCKNDFPDECPSCLHSPVPKEDFKPNKKLRNTIKAFLKSKVTEQANKKKRAEAAAKIVEITPALPSETSTPAVDTVAPAVTAPEAEAEPAVAAPEAEPTVNAASGVNEAPAPSNEQATDDDRPMEHEAEQASKRTDAASAPIGDDSQGLAGHEQLGDPTKDAQNAMNMANGNMGFPNMNGFPMDPSMMNMGAAMGVDPMTMMQQMSQMQAQMFGGFNGGMNMNGGFNQYGAFNGQQNGWVGQDNYNSNYGGYNSGNFNQMNQQYDRNGFQYGFRGRGRGRGRGFHARGGYNQNYRGNAGGYGYNPQYQQNYEQGQAQYAGQDGDQSVSKWGGSEGADGQYNGDAQMVDEDKPEGNENMEHSEQAGEQAPDDTCAQNGDEQNHADVTSHAEKEQQSANSTAEAVPADDGQPMAIQTFMSDDPRGRYGHKMMATPAPVPPSEPRGVPGAPTGPRALREGLPNTGASGRGFAIAGRANANNRPNSDPQPDSQTTSRQGDEMQIEDSKVQSPVDGPSRTSSRTRSRSAQRSSRHKSRRERSRSHDSYEYEDEKRERRDEKRHRRHKHEGEHAEEESTHKSSHRSHRSHRHRDRSRDKDRKDKDRDRDYERRHHKEEERSDESSSRKRRHRDRDEEDYDRHERKRSRRDRSASYDEDKEKEKDRRPSRKHRDSKPTTPITPSTPTLPINDSASRRASLAAIAERRLNRPLSSSGPPAGAPLGPSSKIIPTGPRNQRDANRRDRHRRKDSMRESSRFDEEAKTAEVPSKPSRDENKDPHTLEREARNRERLQKEMQRRANAGEMGAGGGAGGRSSKANRRVSYKYEDEDPEERRREIEREREDARWG